MSLIDKKKWQTAVTLLAKRINNEVTFNAF